MAETALGLAGAIRKTSGNSPARCRAWGVRTPASRAGTRAESVGSWSGSPHTARQPARAFPPACAFPPASGWPPGAGGVYRGVQERRTNIT
jgi:hypothetical protein